MDKAVEAARKALRDQGCNTNTMCSFVPCQCVERAITAADEARAVTDEEVARIFLVGNERDGASLNRVLHAAGFKVIRG